MYISEYLEKTVLFQLTDAAYEASIFHSFHLSQPIEQVIIIGTCEMLK